MIGRLRNLGLVLAALGLVFVAASGYAFIKTQQGNHSLQALSAAQNVKLSYNDAGQLVSGGTTTEAEAIMSLLKNDWGYPVDAGELNPNDPVVNTASEYMFQMATITYHTLNSTQTVVLPADVTVGTTLYPAGEYKFDVAGRYWSAFDRTNPIEAAARAQAWTGTAHALIAELGVGTATASALQLGLGITGLFLGMGLFALLSGFGLVWATRAQTEVAPKRTLQPASPAPMPV